MVGDFSPYVETQTQTDICCQGGQHTYGVRIDEPGTTRREAAPSALRDAASHLRASLRADGAADGEDEDFERPEREWASLIQWAEDQGLILPASFPAAEKEGGREHLVRFDSSAGLWWKYTHLSTAGKTVSWDLDGRPYMHNALPLQYLERLLLQNQVFGDEVQLRGLWNPSGYDWTLVSTQPHVVGEKVSLMELKKAFELVGFECLPWRGIGYADSLAFRKEGFDVWDVHPANALVTSDGLPLPFDTVLTLTPSVFPTV